MHSIESGLSVIKTGIKNNSQINELKTIEMRKSANGESMPIITDELDLSISDDNKDINDHITEFFAGASKEEIMGKYSLTEKEYQKVEEESSIFGLRKAVEQYVENRTQLQNELKQKYGFTDKLMDSYWNISQNTDLEIENILKTVKEYNLTLDEYKDYLRKAFKNNTSVEDELNSLYFNLREVFQKKYGQANFSDIAFDKFLRNFLESNKSSSLDIQVLNNNIEEFFHNRMFTIMRNYNLTQDEYDDYIKKSINTNIDIIELINGDKQFMEKHDLSKKQFKVCQKLATLANVDIDKVVQDIDKFMESNKQKPEFSRYELDAKQIRIIARAMYQEQNTFEGVCAETSLLANLFELYNGSGNLCSYIESSEWFADETVAAMNDSNSNFEQRPDAEQKKILKAIKSILLKGKRTYPKYIDEHDCESDIENDPSYIPHVSIIENTHNSTYFYYGRPNENNDPFGYTSIENRKKYGEFHYDSMGNPVYDLDDKEFKKLREKYGKEVDEFFKKEEESQETVSS